MSQNYAIFCEFSENKHVILDIQLESGQRFLHTRLHGVVDPWTYSNRYTVKDWGIHCRFRLHLSEITNF